ncbi:MAG TPA: SGNH/GDSL hydrolase family protein [Polyangiaceae bacterium]
MDRTWLYAGLLVAAGFGVSSLLKRGPRIRRGDKLLLFGDSLAQGLTPVLGKLASDNGVGFAATSKVGSTIREWAGASALAAGLRTKLAERPAVVLCSLGTNDEYLSLDSARGELPALDALIEIVRAGGAELGWIGPPRLPKPGNGISAVIQSKLPQNRYFHSERFDIPRAPDGLHPTVLGYAGWAGQLWQWVSG